MSRFADLLPVIVRQCFFSFFSPFSLIPIVSWLLMTVHVLTPPYLCENYSFPRFVKPSELLWICVLSYYVPVFAFLFLLINSLCFVCWLLTTVSVLTPLNHWQNYSFLGFIKQNELLRIYFLSYYVRVSAFFFFFCQLVPFFFYFFCSLIPIVCWLLMTVSVLTPLYLWENYLFLGVVRQNELLWIYFLSYYVHVSAFFFFFFC